MKLRRYWSEKGVVYDLARPYHIYKTRSFRSTCNALNDGTRDPESLQWEVADLPRFFIHFGSIHDRKRPNLMAVYYTCCYGETVPDYYVAMMQQKIDQMVSNKRYVTHGISWSSFLLEGSCQQIQLPIQKGYIWSNHGNYWLWSTRKPVWVPKGSRQDYGGLYAGESYRLDVPFFNEDYMPDWSGAKDSLYEVIN